MKHVREVANFAKKPYTRVRRVVTKHYYRRKQWFFQWLATLLLRWLQRSNFGAVYEHEVPPEFIITGHAKGRMMSRMLCKESRVKDIAMRGWYEDTGTIPKKQLKRIEQHLEREQKAWYNYVYTICDNWVYVWKVQHNKRIGTQKVLVTIFHATQHHLN